VPDQVRIVTNHDLQALEEAIPPEVAQLDVRSRVATPRRIIDMNSLLSKSRITTRREQRSYWHLVTLTILCVITILAFTIYALKSYTHKMIVRCMTRQNTSSQNATKPNPVRETSCMNSDANAPDAKSNERCVTFSAHLNLFWLWRNCSQRKLRGVRPDAVLQTLQFPSCVKIYTGKDTEYSSLQKYAFVPSERL